MGKYGEYEEEQIQLNKEDKKMLWDVSFGLQKADYLQPSSYMLSLAEDHIEGKLTLNEIENLLYRHYEEETPEQKKHRLKEADLVSTRINRLLGEGGFSLNPGGLKAIHRFLFKDIYDHAGTFRDVNLTKGEPILGMQTVKYANYFMIEDTYAYDFAEEKKTRYGNMSKKDVVEHIAKFTSSIWQVHPFKEGNTRTTAVFIERYLNSLGFGVNNEPFKDHSLYFRNALVRSNYADYSKGIDSTDVFLHRFFENILFDGKNILKNRDMVVKELLSLDDRIAFERKLLEEEHSKNGLSHEENVRGSEKER